MSAAFSSVASSSDAYSIAAVICAAGKSSRFSNGTKKEYLEMKESDLTVLGSSVCAFAAVPAVKTIVIAIPENDEQSAKDAVPKDLSAGKDVKIIFVTGGASRRSSVYNALLALVHHNPDYVLIHDGARPWINSPFIEEIIEKVKIHDAVIPLLPLTETPKEHNGTFITNHPKRVNVGTAQTPQAFKFTEILNAHQKAAAVEDEEFTDDAEIWGKFCGRVAVVNGLPENRKITFKEDLCK